jgi:PAS domain S-box-containing protein
MKRPVCILALFVAVGCLIAVDLELGVSRRVGARETLLLLSVLGIICVGALMTVMWWWNVRREHVDQRATIDSLPHEERTEKALLETLIGSAPVGFAVVNADLRVVRINERAAEMFGFRPEEVIGRHVSDLSPDSSENVVGVYESVLRTGAMIEGRRVTQDRDGQMLPFELSHYPVRLGDGPPISVGVVAEDVTERVESEIALDRLLRAERESREAAEVANRRLLERNEALRVAQRRFYERTQMLRALTDLAEDVMFVLDREGRCLMINNAGARAVGALPSEIVGTTYDAFLPEAFSRQARGRDLEVMATGRTVVDHETLDTPEGTRQMMTTCAPWVVDGETLGVAVVARTTTQLSAGDRDRDLLLAEARAAQSSMKTALDRLAERNARLQELDRAKDELVALVSHDLRTPLTSIRGYTELLMTGPGVDERGQRLLEVIDRNSCRLLGLVDDLLVVAQHNVGVFTVQVGELDLGELVSEALVSFAPAAAEKRLALVQRVEGSGQVVGDRARLGRMLDNLVGNAIKFTQPGGVVEVGLTMSSERALLRVRDNGPGIAPEDQRHIFDHFARARDSGDGGLRGIGLGLAIARAIAEGHAGTIGLDSSPGTGATFWVELPVAGPPEHDLPVGSRELESRPAAASINV